MRNPNPPSRQFCSPHTNGVDPRAPRTFDPGCPKCQQLKADGKRTGNEPPPSINANAYGRGMSRASWAQYVAKRKARTSV